MIRELRLTDVPLQLLPGRLGAEDLVTNREELTGRPHRLTTAQLAKWSFATRRGEHGIAASNHARLNALLVLRQRQGPRAWEIAHLFAVDDAETAIRDLLERAVGYVASQRGERLFLRLPYDSPLKRTAETSGFRLAFEEDVFELERQMSQDLHIPPLRMRPPLSADTYGLFRLYNATMPVQARAALGQTLDQWQDAGECVQGHVREYVWVHEESILGWVRLDQRGENVTIDAVLHPKEEEKASSFVSYAAQLAWGHRHPIWVVPGHQPAIARTLERRGWEHTRSYQVLVRPVAKAVEEPAMSPAVA